MRMGAARRAVTARASAPVLAAVVVLAGVVMSLSVGAVLVAGQRDNARDQMDRRSNLVAEAVAGEAGRYADTVRTVAGATGAFETLTAAKFAQLTTPLRDIHLAGATSIAYLVPASDSEIPAVEALWRGRGVPDLRLQASGAAREHIFSVFSVSLDGFGAPRYGIDATQSAAATHALGEARRSGHVAISDPYELLIDQTMPESQRQQSFILTAPVYGPPDARGQRPFRGWIVLGMRGRDFISATLRRASQNQVDVGLSAPTNAGTRTRVATQRAAVSGERDLTRTATVDVADRHWRVEVRAVGAKLPGAGPALPLAMTGTGLALAFLLAGLVYVLATGRARATAQVRAATADLAAAEAAARDQADLLAAILDSISDGVGVVDRSGDFLLHNPAAKAILGVPEDKDGADNWQSHYGIFCADGVTPFPTDELPLVRALAGESTEQVEMVIRNASHPGGITITVSGRPLHTASGPHGAVAVFHDITARKEVKAQLAAVADALRVARDDVAAQKGYLDQILDTIGVTVVACDTTGTIVRANRAAHPAFRSSGEPLTVAQALSTMDARHPDGRPVTLAESPLVRALDGVHTDGMEAVIPLPDGSTRTVVIHAQPLLDAAGGTIGAVATSYNITALREREAELHAFAGVVAHDLKAPLTAVGGYAEILHDDLADGAPAAVMRGSLDRVRAGVHRMRRLIDDLLTYATARDADLQHEPVDMSALVADVVTERTAHLRAGTTDNGNPVLFPDIYTGPLPAVNADRVMVRQLLDNLIGNALKYTLPGQPARIDIAAQERGGRVSVQIADRGIGIPADEQPHVFNTFHRSAAHNNYSGTGLGLAICHRVVERHGGTIAVSDNPGGGTRVTFTLPAADRAVTPVAAQAQPV
jgi:signal transduction histidine kinase